MKKLLLLSALLIFASGFSQNNKEKSLNNKKVILIGKTQKLGPYLRKKIGANTYFLSYDYFKIVDTNTKKMERRKHRIAFKASEDEIEMLYNNFYAACGGVGTTTIKVGETLFKFIKSRDCKFCRATITATKDDVFKGQFSLHQTQVDMLFGKRPFNQIWLPE